MTGEVLSAPPIQAKWAHTRLDGWAVGLYEG